MQSTELEGRVGWRERKGVEKKRKNEVSMGNRERREGLEMRQRFGKNRKDSGKEK